MTLHVKRVNRLTCLLSAGMALTGVIPVSFSAEAPPPLKSLEKLGAEEFRERMVADEAIRDWAAARADGGKAWLLQQLRATGEPECRLRLRRILRDQVVREEMAKAPGYVGIRMNETAVPVPEQELAKAAVLVTAVVAGGPAEAAGLKAGDSILSINGKDFDPGPAMTAFSTRVGAMKAGTRIEIQVWREGKRVNLPVVLAGRPLSLQLGAAATLPNGVGQPGVNAAAEEAARERLFRDWLGRQPAGKAP